MNIIFDIWTHQPVVKGENADISAMMYVVSPHDRISMILHPNSSQGIADDLIIFVVTLKRTTSHLKSAIKYKLF